MNLPLTASGRNGTLSFDGQTVSINRTGFLARATVGKGEKRIPVSQIAAIQLKPASAVSNGFIQFTIAGGIERRNKFGSATNDAMKDENSVVFWKKEQPAFEAIRDAIESVQQQRQAPVQRPQDLGGQLAQLADLYQRGALNEQEYAAAKARLLG